MKRRALLRYGAAALPVTVAGCTTDALPGGNDGGSDPPDSPTPTPAPTPDIPDGAVRVSIGETDDQPDVPVEYAVEMAEPLATDEHPARLRVTVSNPTDAPVTLGEERPVQFHHVTSEDRALYLMPAENGRTGDLVEPGCWKLTDHVAVATYYGTVEVPAGDTVTAESFVFGHVEAAGECLPDGDHRVAAHGTAAGDGREVIDGEGTEYEWGLTLRVTQEG